MAGRLTRAEVMERSYALTQLYLTGIQLGVDLELARRAGLSSVAMADRLGIDVGTLVALETALCHD